jgi:hypothetical protein
VFKNGALLGVMQGAGLEGRAYRWAVSLYGKGLSMRLAAPSAASVAAMEAAMPGGGAVAAAVAPQQPPPQAQLLLAEPEPEPEPAPSAEEGVPPPLTVDGWLASIKLAQYAAPLTDYGYDSLKVLLDATEADIVEMTEDPDVGMKKPHRRTMLAEWQQLKSAPQPAGGGGGGGGAAAAAAGDSDALVIFGARCVDFDESESGMLGPVRGVFDDKTNPRVGIDKAIEGTVSPLLFFFKFRCFCFFCLCH